MMSAPVPPPGDNSCAKYRIAASAIRNQCNARRSRSNKATFEVPSPRSTLCAVNVDNPVPPLVTETGVDNEIVVDPPKVSAPPPVNPVPAVIVKLFETTLPLVTVKLVGLNEATPFWDVLALMPLIVTVDPLPAVVIPKVGEPEKILILFGVGGTCFVNVVGTDPDDAIVILPAPLVMGITGALS